MKYLAAFASSATLDKFRLPEFLSVAATLGIDVTVLDHSIPWMHAGDDAVWFSVFESAATQQQLEQLAARCMLLRGLYTLFESAPTLEALYACLEDRLHDTSPTTPTTTHHPQCSREKADTKEGEGEKMETANSGATAHSAFAGEPMAAHLTTSTSYCYQVETIGKKYTGEAKQAILEAVVQRVRLHGEVNWRTPQRRYYVFLEHAVERAPPGARGWVSNGPLLRVFHCCLCVEAGRCAMLATYDLKRRPYIGTTSMPPEESMVMANMSGVLPGHFVCDPFCGTGSLLVAAAHCGAKTFGCDADGRALRAGTEKGKASPQMQQQRQLALATYTAEQRSLLTAEELVLPTMWTNFKLYGLPPPDRARMNFSAWPQTWRAGGCGAAARRGQEGAIFDSIISDPPYGVREPRKKVEASSSPSSNPSPAAAATATTDLVTLSAYATSEVVLDLVLFAAAHLALGGHLTFWHPTTDNYTDDELPTHPSLRVLHNIPQRLSLKMVRRLVVMRKVAAVPSPPPSRESCAPRKAPDDLRALMDATTLDDNDSYMQYRARRERRRQARQQYMAATEGGQQQKQQQQQQAGEEDGDGDEGGSSSSRTTPTPTSDHHSAGGNRRAHKSSRLDGQYEIVANRLRNIKEREAKQAASHLANIAQHKTQGGEKGL